MVAVLTPYSPATASMISVMAPKRGELPTSRLPSSDMGRPREVEQPFSEQGRSAPALLRGADLDAWRHHAPALLSVFAHLVSPARHPMGRSATGKQTGARRRP